MFGIRLQFQEPAEDRKPKIIVALGPLEKELKNAMSPMPTSVPFFSPKTTDSWSTRPHPVFLTIV